MSNGNKKNIIKEIENGWFTEVETLWPGQKFSLALEDLSEENSILYHQESDFQDILVFRSAQYGNVLVLDGVIQLTERDEFSYHEMMVHLPLCSHPNPRRVLIVGGGDGGVLREVCRHSSVHHITLVEIDQQVINVCQQFFAESTATCFQDPRLTVVNLDAADFVEQQQGNWDIIIADTSDPVGPAESLFRPIFYDNMYKALSQGGIICCQAECLWIHLDLICDLIDCCSDIFDRAEYASTMIPTYPCGQIGFVLARKGSNQSLRIPIRQPSFLDDLQWYSPAQHTAAFTLPPFVARKLSYYDKEENSETDEYKCLLEHSPIPNCTLL